VCIGNAEETFLLHSRQRDPRKFARLVRLRWLRHFACTEKKLYVLEWHSFIFLWHFEGFIPAEEVPMCFLDLNLMAYLIWYQFGLQTHLKYMCFLAPFIWRSVDTSSTKSISSRLLISPEEVNTKEC
jgi:hypothetical protein